MATLSDLDTGTPPYIPERLGLRVRLRSGARLWLPPEILGAPDYPLGY
jgi:hypothetical protein